MTDRQAEVWAAVYDHVYCRALAGGHGHDAAVRKARNAANQAAGVS